MKIYSDDRDQILTIMTPLDILYQTIILVGCTRAMPQVVICDFKHTLAYLLPLIVDLAKGNSIKTCLGT